MFLKQIIPQEIFSISCYYALSSLKIYSLAASTRHGRQIIPTAARSCSSTDLGVC